MCQVSLVAFLTSTLSQKVMCMDIQDASLARERRSEAAPENQPAQAQHNRRHLRRIVGISLVGLLCLGFLVLLGSQLLTPASYQAASVSPLIGHPAPDFTLATLSASAGSQSASSLHLASLKGKSLIINFWASWCDPCKHEAPLLGANWPILQSQGILLLGIDFQDTHSDGLAFLRTYGITYPNVVDSTGSTAINYGVSAVPETFFLNRQGIIVSKVIGEVTEQSLQSNVHLLTQAQSLR